jgi:ABC-type lipopolysaccharide export system ATPase subunit
MFDWFRNYRKSEGSVAEDMNKVMNDMNNVVKFPELKTAPPPMPAIEEPAKIFYRIGVTDNNRVAFSMGYSEITMTKLGCEQMIEQLEVFMNQLNDEEQNTGKTE